MKQTCPFCDKMVTNLRRHQQSKYCQSRQKDCFHFIRLPTDLQLYIADYIDNLENWLILPGLRSIAQELIYRRYKRDMAEITPADAVIFYRFGHRRICTSKVINYYHIPRDVALTIPHDTFTNPYNHTGLVRLFRLSNIYKILLQRHGTLDNFIRYRMQKLIQTEERRKKIRLNRLIKDLEKNRTTLPDYDPLQLVSRYISGQENNLDYIIQRIQQIRFLREYRSFDLVRQTFLSAQLSEADLFARVEQFCLRYSVYPDIFPWQE